MAISLSLGTVVQSNDCTTLKIIDNTGEYSVDNTGGWGAPNDALSTLDGANNILTVTITIADANGTETTYDAIDFYEYLGATPSTVDDLLMYVTPNLLVSEGVALGTSTDPLPDGWYTIVYDLSDVSTEESISSYTVQCLVEGTVRNKIYYLMRTLPTDVYLNTPNRINVHDWEELTFPLYVLSLYEAMTAYVVTTRKAEILSTLYVIENLTANITL